MGNVLSQGSLFPSLSFSSEVEQSLNQIIFAFQNETFVLNHRSSRHHHHHHHHHHHRQIESENEQISVESSTHHQRSRSADRIVQGNIQRFHRPNCSIVARQWECQLCHLTNESDSQLCSECGSNKINVYIPVMNYSFDKTRSAMKARHSDNENFVQRDEKSSIDSTHRRSVLISHKREADEHIVLRHVDKILRRCQISNCQFKDETFPASSSSLFINGNSFSPSTLTLLPDQQESNLRTSTSNKIVWLRPNQIHPCDWTENNRTSWAVFRDPRPNDVLQGALGDCWFITALSVLAEEPEYLMRILITKQFNQEGIYCVRLCKDGEWTQVFIDDRLPCTSNKRLAYSQAHRKQLWVPLIEKALAKLHGSYEAIIAGRCCEGLSTVTGSPCETLILGRSNNPDDKNVDHDKLWIKLLHARSQRFLMCAMCSNNLIKKEEFEKFGLLNIHAYSLQDVRQSRDGKHRLVKLRNPWGGTYRWKGDWSDDSRLWTENPDLRRDLLNERQNQRDGVFWMPFHSFVKYFECVDICKLRNNWYEVRDTANFYPSSNSIQAYKLTINETTDLDLTLHRKISKNLRIQRSEVSLCLAVVSMEESSSNGGHYRIYSMPIVSQRGQHKFISTDGQLKAGSYFILPFLFNAAQKYLDNTNFSLAIHSSHLIDLERIKLPGRIEREFLIKLCIFYGDPVYLSNHFERHSGNGDDVNIYELKQYWDGLILLVENRHPSKFVHFHFRCTIAENAFISRKDSPRELFDVIPPNYRQIIVSISRKNASESYTIGHDFEYVLSSQDTIKYGQGIYEKHWPKIDESSSSSDIHRPQLISSAKRA